MHITKHKHNYANLIVSWIMDSLASTLDNYRSDPSPFDVLIYTKSISCKQLPQECQMQLLNSNPNHYLSKVTWVARAKLYHF